MVGGGGRGPYATGVARRERILDAAEAHFAAGGFSRVSMVDIARDVGMTAPGLSHHFRSKEDLLLGIAERRFRVALATAAEAPADHDGLGPLRIMLEQTRRRSERPDLIELFVKVLGLAADPTSRAHELFRGRYERAIEDLGARLQAGVDAGFLREDLDCRHVAQDLIAFSDGLQIQWAVSEGDLEMESHMRAHLEQLAPLIIHPGHTAEL